MISYHNQKPMELLSEELREYAEYMDAELLLEDKFHDIYNRNGKFEICVSRKR